MKTSSLLVLSFIATLFTSPVTRAEAANAGDLIVVSGLGQIAVEPNMAFVEGAVLTEAKTVREAQQLNAKTFNAAVEQLKARFKFEAGDLQTAGYTVQPVYDTRPNGTAVLRGYSVRHNLKVTVRDLASLGAVVDQMATGGVNQLTLIRFSHNDKQTFEMKALAAAMENARMKADIIAKSSGRAITRITRVDYQSMEQPEAVVRGEALKESGSSVTEFIPGELVIRASVSVQFEF